MGTDVTARVFVAGKNNVLVRVGQTFVQANATKAQALGWEDRIIRCSQPQCANPAAQLDPDVYQDDPRATLCREHWEEE